MESKDFPTLAEAVTWLESKIAAATGDFEYAINRHPDPVFDNPTVAVLWIPR